MSKTGGQELNRPTSENRTHSSSGYDCACVFTSSLRWRLIAIVVDDDDVVRKASTQSSGESSLFSTALSFINNNKVSISR